MIPYVRPATVFRRKGAGSLRSVSLHSGQPDYGANIEDFKSSFLSFYADGRFTYEPSRLSISHDLRCFSGSYEMLGEAILFQAEHFKFADHSIDGLVTRNGEDYGLSCVVLQDDAFLTCTHILQALLPVEACAGTAATEEVEGITVPSAYEISLTGEVDQVSFGPVQARLDISVNALAGALRSPEELRINLHIHSHTQETGSFNFTLNSDGEVRRQEAVQASCGTGDGQVCLTVKSSYLIRPSPDISWITVARVTSDNSTLPLTVPSEECTVVFEADGDGIRGRIEGVRSGPYLSFEGESSYRAKFTGTRIIDDPSSYEEITSITTCYQPKTWEEGDLFTGCWEESRLGSINLFQEQERVHGRFDGATRGVVEGKVDGNRACLTWKTNEGEQGHLVLRAVRGGKMLAGLQWAAAAPEQAVPVLARSEQPTSNLPEKALASLPTLFDPEKLAGALERVGRVDEAVRIYEKLLPVYRERAADNHLSTSAWAALKFAEATVLRGLLNCCWQMVANGKAIKELYQRALQVMKDLIALEQERRERLSQSTAHSDYLQLSFVNNLQGLVDRWIFLAKDDAERVEMLEEAQLLYRQLVKSFADTGEIKEALIWSENARARAMASLLAGRKNHLRFAGEMFEADEIAAGSFGPGLTPSVNWDLIAYAAETSNSFIVEYFLGEEELFIWVISPTGDVALRRMDLRDLRLDDLITGVEYALSTNPRNFILNESKAPNIESDLLKHLFQILIEPIVDLLPSDERQHVTFIPHGILFQIPFAALRNGDQYLVERHTILVSPSVSVLHATYLNTSPVGMHETGALVVGDPENSSQADYPAGCTTALPPLKYAREEAQEIASLLNAKLYVGREALKSEIVPQLGQRRLIHFATHGVLNARREGEIPGALLLASSCDANEFLTAAEISEMNMRAELVTLSACRTGQGNVTADGIIGLARAFFAAGAMCLVVSLWAVEDHSTKEFMVQFYKLMTCYSDKAQALRAAMLHLIRERKFDAPINWAGFIILGKPSVG